MTQRSSKRAGLTHQRSLEAALVQVVDYYHETLKQRPEALGYLAGRGLGSRECHYR